MNMPAGTLKIDLAYQLWSDPASRDSLQMPGEHFPTLFVGKYRSPLGIPTREGQVYSHSRIGQLILVWQQPHSVR